MGGKKLNRLFGMLSILIRENLISGILARRPEENLVMETQDQVDAWHKQGANDGPITPIYHLNALTCSYLAPFRSTVIDLGCGSGRYSAYLARQRPDLRIIGFDLSEPMVETGNAVLKEEGLDGRVELRQGDMTAFSRELPAETGLINCLFAIHHLPDLREVEQCLTEIREASEKTGCSFLIFDLVRPRHEATTIDYPQVFTPDAPEAFRLDSTNSLVAAYSHAELKRALERVFGRSMVKATRSRLLPLYQAFWRGDNGRHIRGKVEAEPSLPNGGTKLPLKARSQYRALRAILPELPR